MNLVEAHDYFKNSHLEINIYFNGRMLTITQQLNKTQANSNKFQ